MFTRPLSSGTMCAGVWDHVRGCVGPCVHCMFVCVHVRAHVCMCACDVCVGGGAVREQEHVRCTNAHVWDHVCRCKEWDGGHNNQVCVWRGGILTSSRYDGACHVAPRSCYVAPRNCHVRQPVYICNASTSCLIAQKPPYSLTAKLQLYCLTWT